MTEYNKKKGIIYVNTQINAENLYKLMKKQNEIDIYIYISNDSNIQDKKDTNIHSFENNNKHKKKMLLFSNKKETKMSKNQAIH